MWPKKSCSALFRKQQEEFLNLELIPEISFSHFCNFCDDNSLILAKKSLLLQPRNQLYICTITFVLTIINPAVGDLAPTL